MTGSRSSARPAISSSTFLVEQHQSAYGPMGRQLGEPDAVPGRSRAPRSRGGRHDFIVIFRISAMDMLEGGLAWDEIVMLAQGASRRRA